MKYIVLSLLALYAFAQSPQPSLIDHTRIAGGGTGTGASQTSQLVDWAFTKVNATQLSFGANCLPLSPCIASIGGTTYSFTSGPYLINLTGSNTGTTCTYLDPTGILSVGYGNGLSSGNITGSNTIAFVSGQNNCPQDSAKLGRWDVTSGAFNSTGFPYASYLSYKPSPLAGTGVSVGTGSRDTISIDTTSVLRKFSCVGGPSSNLPAGATWGDICFDTTLTTPAKYVCSNVAGCTVSADWNTY